MDREKLKELKMEYQAQEMTEGQIGQMKQAIASAKAAAKKTKPKHYGWKMAAAAAAAAFLLLPNLSKNAAYAMSEIPFLGRLVEVVTFRDYQYEDGRHTASVRVPEILTDKADTPASESLQKTAEEINAEIKAITDRIVDEFKEIAKDKEGYQDIIVEHEVIASTERYFTLKLICYQGAGSGSQWNYFYTIDLATGERLALKDLFADGADYITAISSSIKQQMRAQMEADENVYYWLDEEVEDWNFKQITDDVSFYLNADENLVICFNDGDVAPMYMGCVEFVIPEEAIEGMRK